MGCEESKIPKLSVKDQLKAQEIWKADNVYVPYWTGTGVVYAVTRCLPDEIPRYPLLKGDRVPGKIAPGVGLFALQKIHILIDPDDDIIAVRNPAPDIFPPKIVPHDFILQPDDVRDKRNVNEQLLLSSDSESYTTEDEEVSTLR